MASSNEQMVLRAANDSLGAEHVAVALRGLAVLLARAHVQEIAGSAAANRTEAPASAPRRGGR